jgi:hypothetical protein
MLVSWLQAFGMVVIGVVEVGIIRRGYEAGAGAL